MRKLAWLATAALGAGLAGCFSTHTENARLQMPWPNAQPRALVAYARADPDWPSIGGNILKGASPAEQARERDAADRRAGRAWRDGKPRRPTPPAG